MRDSPPHSVVIARLLVAVVVAIVVSFLLISVIARAHAAAIDDDVSGIVKNAMPSVRHLSTARSALYRLYAQHDRFSSFTITIVYAVYVVGIVVSLIFAGHISDWYGRRVVLAAALTVAIGSAIPFVPTGEMVSGSSALAARSRVGIILIFLVTWLASVIGDTVLLMEARLGARKLRPWLARRKYAGRVEQAQQKLHRNAFSAIITGRLVPGGRAPVIIALGIGRYPIRRFIAYDTIACGLWALIYSTIGSIGGRGARSL